MDVPGCGGSSENFYNTIGDTTTQVENLLK